MIGGVVLAAGAGSRMGGRAKALIEVDGEVLLHRVLDRFVEAGVTDLGVVLGAQADAVSGACAAWSGPMRQIRNPLWHTGQAGSVLAALDAAPKAWNGVLITPVDQPDLSSAVIAEMATCSMPARPILADGTPTHPAFLPRDCWPAVIDALRTGPADRGAGGWLARHGCDIPVGHLVIRARDVDTTAELDELNRS